MTEPATPAPTAPQTPRFPKFCEAEYIESGAFQGGEEDTSKAAINYGDDVIVLHKKHLAPLKKAWNESAARQRVIDAIQRECESWKTVSPCGRNVLTIIADGKKGTK